jgi:hypothetical protein
MRYGCIRTRRAQAHRLGKCESEQARAKQRNAGNGHGEETVRSEFFTHGTLRNTAFDSSHYASRRRGAPARMSRPDASTTDSLSPSCSPHCKSRARTDRVRESSNKCVRNQRLPYRRLFSLLCPILSLLAVQIFPVNFSARFLETAALPRFFEFLVTREWAKSQKFPVIFPDSREWRRAREKP